MQVVHSQFVLLGKLQRLDARLRALEVEQQRLPQQLQPYAAACTEARQGLARLQDDIQRRERQRRGIEQELESLQTQLAKTQVKLHEVKNNKEYSAVLAEIAAGKQGIVALEDQILDLMERLEQDRHMLQRQEQRVQEAGQAFMEQGKHVQQGQEALVQQLEMERVQHQQIVAELDPKLYATYQRIAAQRDGQAVVYLQHGICGGCHLKVQPQLVSEIRQQDQLFTCPHCQRLLLWPAE
jgi:hypothetical protein